MAPERGAVMSNDSSVLRRRASSSTAFAAMYRGCQSRIVLIGSAVVLVVLLCAVGAALEWQPYTPITYDAELVHETAKNAYDGSADTRTMIGIGEQVKLYLVSNGSPSDADQCRPNSQAEWTIVYDMLQGPFWDISSGTADHDFEHDPKTVTARKTGGDHSFTVRVYITDSTTPAGRNDEDDWERTVTFNVKVPNDLAWVENSAYPYSVFPLGNISVAGKVIRWYQVQPASVNFDNVIFKEDVPSSTFVWNNGVTDQLPAMGSTFEIFLHTKVDGETKVPGCMGDSHATPFRPLAYINLNGVPSTQEIPWPGAFGWQMYDNTWTYPIDWIHDITIAASGRTTLHGNGNSCSSDASGKPFGPWLVQPN